MEEILTQAESELTPKELLFINYYLANNLNATLAAKLAGFSQASAYELGHRLLKKVEVKKVIDQYLKNESIEAQELLKRLSDTAKNRAMDYLNPDGTVDLRSLKDNGLMHLVKSVRKGKGGKIHVTFYDAQKAQDTLAKILKLTTDGLNVTVNIDERIIAEQKLTEELLRIHDRFIEDPIERQVDEYRQQLKRGTNQ
jgi:phage terminase small subunit